MKNLIRSGSNSAKMACGIVFSCAAMATTLSAQASPVGNVVMQWTDYRNVNLVGDSRLPGYAGAISLLSFMQTTSIPINTGSAGTAVGKAACGQVAVSKNIDLVSTPLLLNLFSGSPAKTVVLTILSAAGQNGFQYPVYTVTMSNVYVSSISQVESSGNIVENLTLAADSYVYSYQPIQENGTLGQKVISGWDCKRNVKM